MGKTKPSRPDDATSLLDGHPGHQLNLADYPERRSRRPGKREDEHLRLARLVQEGLLPPSSIELPGLELAFRYLPSQALGGDFCDYFVLENNTVGLYLGDVQGKGVGAALFALLVSGVIRGIHKSGHQPADVLCLLNQRVCFRSAPDRFSCIGYAVFDLEQRRVTFSNAGVPFPLLLRDGRLSRLALTGLPIGLFEATHYDQVSLDLLPGDQLLFYTDGLAESLTPRRQKVPDGQKNLERVFTRVADHSATDLADALLAKIRGNGKRPRRRQRDDATFIIARVD